MTFGTLVDIIILLMFLGMSIILVAVLADHRKVVMENDSLREALAYYQGGKDYIEHA